MVAKIVDEQITHKAWKAAGRQSFQGDRGRPELADPSDSIPQCNADDCDRCSAHSLPSKVVNERVRERFVSPDRPTALKAPKTLEATWHAYYALERHQTIAGGERFLRSVGDAPELLSSCPRAWLFGLVARAVRTLRRQYLRVSWMADFCRQRRRSRLYRVYREQDVN